MPISKAIIALTAILFTISAGTSAAAEKWWERAAKVISSQDSSQQVSQLGGDEIGEAFKQALQIGSEAVVSQLGGVDGFNGDPAIRIPLPAGLDKVKSALASVRMSGMVDDLELKLNRAAEAATPIAKDLFLQSISAMTFDDVMAIYQGPADSATRYFQEKMSPTLTSQMRPIVEESLSQVGAIAAFDALIGRYKTIPFMPDVSADINDHVIQKAMDGIFFYIAKEEAAIRENPVRQTTDLLKKVFGTL